MPTSFRLVVAGLVMWSAAVAIFTMMSPRHPLAGHNGRVLVIVDRAANG